MSPSFITTASDMLRTTDGVPLGQHALFALVLLLGRHMMLFLRLGPRDVVSGVGLCHRNTNRS